MSDDITFCPPEDDDICDRCGDPGRPCQCGLRGMLEDIPDEDDERSLCDELERSFCDDCGVCVAEKVRGVWQNTDAEHDEECGTRTYCDECGVVVSRLVDHQWKPVEHTHGGGEDCEPCPACAALAAERGEPVRPLPLTFDEAEIAAVALALALAAAAPATSEGMRDVIDSLARKFLLRSPIEPAAAVEARDRLLAAEPVEGQAPVGLSIVEAAAVGCLLAIDAAGADDERRAQLLPVAVALLAGDLVEHEQEPEAAEHEPPTPEPAGGLSEADHAEAVAAAGRIIDFSARRAALRPPVPMTEAEYAAELAAHDADPERGAAAARALLGALGVPAAERCPRTMELPLSGGDDLEGA